MLPGEHPIKTDTPGNLLLCGLQSAARFPHLRLHQRLVVALGFLALGLAPRPVLRRYFGSIVSPQRRNKQSARLQFEVKNEPVAQGKSPP
jgi:hypothetical protein